MLSTNQRPTQELISASLRDDKMLEVVENLPEEVRLAGLSREFFTNSPKDVSVLVNWKAPTHHFEQRTGGLQPNTDISLREQLKNAHAAIGELRKSEQRAEETNAHQQAQAWLKKNREKYAGQWIAVRGAELLATGTTAREVYAKVRSMKPSPLILKIQLEDLPFSGW